MHIVVIEYNMFSDLSIINILLSCRKAVKIVTELVVHTDSKVHGANMGPTWVLSAPDGPHVGPMNLAIRVFKYYL